MNIPIKQRVWDNLIDYARACNEIHSSEIAGWAHYTHSKGIYKLAPLCKQEVKPADVDTFPDEILHREDYDMSDMIVQWHSHVNMSTFFSATDVKNVNDCMKLFDNLISIIVNVRGEYTCRVDYAVTNFFGARTIQTLDKVSLDIGNREIPVKIWDDVAMKCSKPKPVIISSPYAYGKWDNYYGHAYGSSYHNPYLDGRESAVQTLFPEVQVDKAVEVDDSIIFSPQEKQLLYGKFKALVKSNPAKIEVISDEKTLNIALQLFDGRIIMFDDDGIEFSNIIYEEWVDFENALKMVYYESNLTY